MVKTMIWIEPMEPAKLSATLRQLAENIETATRFGWRLDMRRVLDQDGNQVGCIDFRVEG